MWPHPAGLEHSGAGASHLGLGQTLWLRILSSPETPGLSNLRQKEVPGFLVYVIACIYWMVQTKLDKLGALGAAPRKVMQVSLKEGENPVWFCSCTPKHCTCS